MKPELKVVYIPESDGVQITSDNTIVHRAFRIQGSKAIVFIPDEFNKFVSDLIKDTLETAAKESKTKSDIAIFQEGSYKVEVVDKQSITDQFENIFEKYKI